MLDILRCAVDEYTRGNYAAARGFYQQLAAQIGEKNFRANIQLCQKRLNAAPATHQQITQSVCIKNSVLQQPPALPTKGIRTTIPILLAHEPNWFNVDVMVGDTVNISAAINYDTANSDGKKISILLVKPLSATGNELDISCGKLSKSKKLGANFKYLECINGKLEEQHTFKVPPLVTKVRIGVARFGGKAQDIVELKELLVAVTTGRSSTNLFVKPSEIAAKISVLGWPEYPANGRPYAIGVMDEFTTGCFEEELNLIQPRPDNWYALAEKYPPALFFIESAWKGNSGSWQYRVADYSNKPGHELEQIAQYAQQKKIPTIFWNKEDPVHHQKFMCSAKLADYIFTTDANMCDSYRKNTGNDKVYALPFAAQPALHKPASLAGRLTRSCFAGSWYGGRHAERAQAINWLLLAANRYGLDIYDRNYGTGIFPFPEMYQKSIKGSLPYKDLCAEYSRYRVFLNVNSVIDSPTMFSRRVFELMACGTPVVSTYAKGIEELFESKAVWLVNNEAEAEEAIKTLLTDDVEWRRRSLAGIREVFSRHTYAHRMNTVLDKIDSPHRIHVDPNLLLLAKVESMSELDSLYRMATSQTYRCFHLQIETPDELNVQIPPPGVELVRSGYICSRGITNKAALYEAIGWLSGRCHYGQNYLLDLANAMSYQPNSDGWAKAIGEDAFAFNQHALHAGSIWQRDVFLSQWIFSRPTQTIKSSLLFSIDSDEFSENNYQSQVVA